MDHNNSEKPKGPGVESGLLADYETLSSEKEQRGSSSSTVTEDPANNGSWSQRSISRSLQRAETLLRSTFHPGLKWLFNSRSLEDCEDQQEEGNFVAAYNLVSRSSAPLLQLQQVIVNVAPQWHLLNRTYTGTPQVCVKSVGAQDAFVPLPSFCAVRGHYRALWRLLEKRSLLLFIHEYTRRAHLMEMFILRLTRLLEDQLRNSQTLFNWVSFRVDLGSLCQELRVHLNHWSCLSSKIHSDRFLKLALAQQTKLLVDIRQTLDLFSLQALVLMEHYVYTLLYAVTQTELDCVPREVLQNILVGTELYNLAVEEQRLQHSTTQLRTMVVQQTNYNALESTLRNRGRHPAAISVKELIKILAVHHAERAAKQLHSWNSGQTHHLCQIHIPNEALAHSSKLMNQEDTLDQGAATRRTCQRQWTWDKLLQTFLDTPPLSPINPHLPSQESPQCLHSETLLKKHHHLSAKPSPVKTRNRSHKCPSYRAQSGQHQADINALDSVQPKLESHINLESFKLMQTLSPSEATSHPVSAFPLTGLCQGQSSVELLFHLVWSNDLFAPLVCNPPTPEKRLYVTTTEMLQPSESADQMISTAAITNATVSEDMMNIPRPDNQMAEETQRGLAELEVGAEATGGSSSGRYGAPETEATVDMEGARVRVTDHRPRSVQWFDLGQPVVFADLFGQYRCLLWTFCSKALWLQAHVPQDGVSSINLQDSNTRFQSLQRISHVSNTDVVPEECTTMLKGFTLYMLTNIAHAEWDYVVCRSLGSSLKDKCLTDVKQSSSSTASSTQDGVITSATMENFLQSLAPVLSMCCHHSSDGNPSGPFTCFPPTHVLQRRTVSLALATMHLSTVWVMSKAYQFLSSWNLDRFLLITQGDLKALKASLLMTMQQTESLVTNSNSDWDHFSFHNHSQLLLQQQLRALDRTVCELQTFSSTVLKTFSSVCKRMSGEIFEQTMPSAVHWRPSQRTGIPIRRKTSEYATAAAQVVIGQVLEGVAPLSDDARVQALSITMTAFMEAWMEYILKQRIKFSVQGALQLKQDFDFIREMIQSDRYGLSTELLQHLLSLRVFQQVDCALVCLLQQPQSKPYLLSRAWEPFTHCCPSTRQRNVSDAAAGSCVINFRGMDGEDMAQSEPSLITTHVPQVDPSVPGEPYLVPSLALELIQQEWLDLRIHGSSRQWMLPGLQCFYKSES